MANKLEFIIKLKDEFSGDLSKLTSKIPTLGAAAVAAAGAIAAAGTALFAMAKSASEAYEQVGNAALQLGIGVEAFSKYKWAAYISDLENQKFEMGMKKLSIAVGSASLGNEQAIKTFADLGISIKNADGTIKSVDQILPEVADGLNNLGSQAQRAALAADLFGARNLQMLKLVGEGSGHLKDLTDEAERFGKVVSEKTVAAAEYFQDNLKRMDGAVAGLKNSFIKQFFPAFGAGMETMANLIAANRETVVQWATVAVNIIGKVAEAILMFGGIVADVFRAVHAVWEGAKASIAALGDAISKTIAWVAGRVADFMGKINFGGMWDVEIQGLRSFEKTFVDIGDSLGKVAEDSAGEVGAYWEAGMARATLAVDMFTDKFKAGEIGPPKTNVAEGEDRIVVPEDKEALKAAEEKRKAQEAAYNELLNLHDQYTLTESERLDSWYRKQQELFTGNQEALLLLEETYNARKDALKTSREEELNAAWEEATLTEEEKLTAWYERQLLLYEGNKQDLALVDEIYAAKKTAFQKTQDQKAATAQKAALDGTLALARVFGGKAVALAQAIAIPKMIMDAWEASANAMKDFPFPVNIGIAAGQFATVMGMVASIRGVSMGVAHGGMDYVPKEQTYLLDRGERVLSPRQNEDLAQFMAEGGGNTTIESLNLHILENATDLDVMRTMDKADWQDIVYEKIVPALKELSRIGVKGA